MTPHVNVLPPLFHVLVQALKLQDTDFRHVTDRQSAGSYMRSALIRSVAACILTTFPRAMSRYHAYPWLSEFSGAVLTCFTLRRSTVLMDDTSIRIEMIQLNQARSGQETCDLMHV